jgi:integrase/recombinase XerC
MQANNKQTTDTSVTLLAGSTDQQINKVFDCLDVSETTRAEYKYRIKLFLEYAKEKGFDYNSFLEFKRYLAERTDIAISTKNKYLATAKVFLKELNRQGLLPADITQNVKTFSQSKKHKRDGLSDSEVKRLIEKIGQLPDDKRQVRLKAIISLLTLQGLRQVEVTRLDVKDLDFISNTAQIHGKGRDDKEPIDLHPETAIALKNYLKVYKVADGALFTSQSHNAKNQRLTTRAIRMLVKDILDSLGIEKTTHGLRHYFTTKLIEAYKGDLLEVAQYTRHKSLEMLQVYNDGIKRKADLPRYYKTFNGVSFC